MISFDLHCSGKSNGIGVNYYMWWGDVICLTAHPCYPAPLVVNATVSLDDVIGQLTVTCIRGHRFPSGTSQQVFSCSEDGTWFYIHPCQRESVGIHFRYTPFYFYFRKLSYGVRAVETMHQKFSNKFFYKSINVELYKFIYY